MQQKDLAPPAHETALEILTWLAGEPDMLSRFLALSGLRADQLRTAVADPAFLAGLLDFVMNHEPTLLLFCEATETKPETVAAAWAKLSGPGLDSGEY
ncbi:DUF3572 domain-containing protein [Rhizobium halophytocola]|uniref:DUF3572 family protein n=1 Tax=Rhizobium halophytocola TaxID=735519 RepID=A0ABS4DY30_9HYPH|nr:DUF3572 domain-containing protein [Rhizobium halophytocola]MBP1850596.1 hypothetical protein [Rhizobium halophytocola]